jgi:hypothetical protein
MCLPSCGRAPELYCRPGDNQEARDEDDRQEASQDFIVNQRGKHDEIDRQAPHGLHRKEIAQKVASARPTED